MRIDPVTLRWAEALHGLARKHGVLDQVQGDVARLSARLAGPLGARAVDPRLDRAARRKLVLAELGSAHTYVVRTVELLFARRREAVLAGLGAAFRRFELRDSGVAEGVVESARPLGTAELDAIARGLGALLGKRLELENRVEPDLIGGARVTADNKMIDWTVRGRLDALERRLMEAPLPQVGGAGAS